jgi:hypothetical protein
LWPSAAESSAPGSEAYTISSSKEALVTNRRNLLKDLVAFGALQGLIASPANTLAVSPLLDETSAQVINPDFDPEAYDFWFGFLGNVATPVIPARGQSRGGKSPFGSDDVQPVFLHYDPRGFKNAAEIDATDLISEGDVSVSLNTSTIKIAPQDQEIIEHLQNAQIRVDVAQKTPIIPVIEAMAYTVASGMISLKATVKGKSKGASASEGGANLSSLKVSGGKHPSGAVQSIAVDSDAAWQKMQNIILPGGEGRWALNLEAQKKDSLMYKLLQNVVKEAGQFSPFVGFPGIALSALQSFNVLYGAMHAKPVPIIKSSPLRVFATQEALQRTGAPGAATGIMLKSGTYILIPANRTPDLDKLRDLTVMQGRIVPPKTQAAQLDAAAADTLRDITYVSFDVEARPARLFPGAERRKSS